MRSSVLEVIQDSYSVIKDLHELLDLQALITKCSEPLKVILKEFPNFNKNYSLTNERINENIEILVLNNILMVNRCKSNGVCNFWIFGYIY